MEKIQKAIENRILNYVEEIETSKNIIRDLKALADKIPDYIITKPAKPELVKVQITKHLNVHAVGGVSFINGKSEKIFILNGATKDRKTYLALVSSIKKTDKGYNVDSADLIEDKEEVRTSIYLSINDKRGIVVKEEIKVGINIKDIRTIASWPIYAPRDGWFLIEPGTNIKDVVNQWVDEKIKEKEKYILQYRNRIEQQKELLKRIEKVGCRVVTILEDDGEFAIGGHYRGMHTGGGLVQTTYVVPSDITEEEVDEIRKNRYIAENLWVTNYSEKERETALSCPITPILPGLEDYDFDYSYGTFEYWMSVARFKKALEERDIKYIKKHPPTYRDDIKFRILNDVWGENPIEGLTKWKEKQTAIKRWVDTLSEE